MLDHGAGALRSTSALGAISQALLSALLDFTDLTYVPLAPDRCRLLQPRPQTQAGLPPPRLASCPPRGRSRMATHWPKSPRLQRPRHAWPPGSPAFPPFGCLAGGPPCPVIPAAPANSPALRISSAGGCGHDWRRARGPGCGQSHPHCQARRGKGEPGGSLRGTALHRARQPPPPPLQARPEGGGLRALHAAPARGVPHDATKWRAAGSRHAHTHKAPSQ